MMFYIFACIALASAHPMSYQINHPRYVVHNENTRIVGGQDAELGEFPWQASLQQNGRHFCGGSLITTRHVMSAAHCELSNVKVALGAVNYNVAEQTISQSAFIPHPQHNSATFDYDYAVIVLAQDATLTTNVNTIKLADAGKEYSGAASTSGWGYNTQFIQTTPATMQKTDITLVSQAACQSVWGSVITITNRIQCAGGDGKVSSCMGDSGGPLTVVDNGETILIGAVSWVQSNCSPNYPGGYAKISAVRSWIDGIISQ